MSTTARASKKRVVSQVAAARELSGQALLQDMRRYQKAVTSTPDAAREFLTRLGVLTATGKTKRLIRG